MESGRRMRFRSAILQDAPRLAEIHRTARVAVMPWQNALHTQAEDLEFISTEVIPNTDIEICETENMVAGFLAGRAGWIEHLYIDPLHFRKGIGGALLSRAKSKQPRLQLWTFQDNLPAQRFYEANGFKVAEATDGSRNDEKMPDLRYVWEKEALA